jgi:predicted CXXCH cytochrome family protein
MSAPCRHANGRSGAYALCLVLVLLAGCAVTERNYKTLSLFFDGVPKPGAAVDTAGLPVIATSADSENIKFTLHPPYENRECEKCHASGFSSELVTSKDHLCIQCHSGDKFQGKFLHAPAASGQCYACHDPHQSQNPHLLLTKGPDICLHCHDRDTFENLERHQSEKGRDCLSCHNPHAAENENFLK